MKFNYLFLFLSFTLSSNAQNKSKNSLIKEDSFQLLETHYNQGLISSTEYLKKIDSLSKHLISIGSFFTLHELTDNMELYSKIAWGEKSLSSYRKNYYLILLNNAYMSNKWGASIYYAEKVKSESKKNGLPRPFIEISVKTFIYSSQQRHDKIIEIFEKEQSYLEKLILNPLGVIICSKID